jgi:hypothetical protein
MDTGTAYQFLAEAEESQSYQALRSAFRKKGRVDAQKEAVIMRDPGCAYVYAFSILRGRWPDAEPVIARDPQAAYKYAIHIIKGRWPQGEAAISKSEYGPMYKQRLKSTEDWKAKMARRAEFAKKNPKKVQKVQRRVREDSMNIKDKADQLLVDAATAPMAEGVPSSLGGLGFSSKNPLVMRAVAQGKRLSKEEEQEILELGDGDAILDYAVNVIKGRWREAEAAEFARSARAHARAGQESPTETGDEDDETAVAPAQRMSKEEEQKLLASGDTNAIYNYAVHVIKGRWPEAEQWLLNHK